MKLTIIGSTAIADAGTADKLLVVTCRDDQAGLRLDVVSQITPDDSITESSFWLSKDSIARLSAVLKEWG